MMSKRLSKERVEEIERLVDSGMTYVDIASLTSTVPSTVREIAQGMHYHQQSAEEQARRCTSHRNYLPTPEEIAAACERFLRESPRLPVGYQPFSLGNEVLMT